jgi:hypothetical protein
MYSVKWNEQLSMKIRTARILIEAVGACFKESLIKTTGNVRKAAEISILITSPWSVRNFEPLYNQNITHFKFEKWAACNVIVYSFFLCSEGLLAAPWGPSGHSRLCHAAAIPVYTYENTGVTKVMYSIIQQIKIFLRKGGCYATGSTICKTVNKIR